MRIDFGTSKGLVGTLFRRRTISMRAGHLGRFADRQEGKRKMKGLLTNAMFENGEDMMDRDCRLMYHNQRSGGSERARDLRRPGLIESCVPKTI